MKKKQRLHCKSNAKKTHSSLNLSIDQMTPASLFYTVHTQFTFNATKLTCLEGKPILLISLSIYTGHNNSLILLVNKISLKMEETIEKIVLAIGLKRIYKVFNVMRNIYKFIDYFLIVTIGYSLVHGWKEDQLKAKNNQMGHLVKILGRGTANPASHVFLDNFMLRHEAYIDPIDFVINNDHVMLL